MDSIFIAHKDTSGHLVYDKEAFRKYVDTLPKDGIYISAGKIKKTRSEQQRKYYYKVIVGTLCDFTGNGKHEMNEILKLHFNPKPAKDIEGNNIMVGGSIEDETIQECERIFEEIRAFFAVECGVIIATPNEVNIDS